jgi:hypothetical protein
LLRAERKIVSVELYPSGEWPEENGGEGLWRVRVGRRWHSPTGKFSFLTAPAVAALLTTLLSNGEAPKEEPAPYLPWKAAVRVYLDDPLMETSGSIHAPPHQERDGRWYVWVWVFGKGPVKLPCNDVQLIRVR